MENDAAAGVQALPVGGEGHGSTPHRKRAETGSEGSGRVKLTKRAIEALIRRAKRELQPGERRPLKLRDTRTAGSWRERGGRRTARWRCPTGCGTGSTALRRTSSTATTARSPPTKPATRRRRQAPTPPLSGTRNDVASRRAPPWPSCVGATSPTANAVDAPRRPSTATRS